MSPSTKTRHQGRWEDRIWLGGYLHSSSGSRATSTVAPNNHIPVRAVCGPSITHWRVWLFTEMHKSALCNRVGVVQVDPSTPDVVIVDMQQMLHHIVWPHGGDAPVLFENTKQRLSSYHGYPPGTERILVFDRYDDISAKGHGRIRRAGEGSTDYNLTINSPLPRTTGGYDVVVRVLQTTIWPSTAHYQGPREDTTWCWGFYRLQSDRQQRTTKDHGRIRRGGEGSTDYNLTVNSPLPRTTGGYDVVVRVLQTTIWPSTAHYQGPREDTTWWWGFYRLQSDRQQPTTKDHGRIRRGGEGSTNYNLTFNSPLPRTTGGYDVVVRVLQATIWPPTAHYQGPREDTTWWWGFYRLQSDHQQPTTKDHGRIRRGGEGSTNYKLTVNSPLPRTTGGYDVVVRVLQTTIWPSTAHYQGPREDTTWWWGFYRLQSDRQQPTTKDHGRIRRGGEGSTDYKLTINSPLPRTTGGYDVVVRVLQTTIWPSTAHYQGPREDTTWWWGFYRLQSDRQQPTTKDQGRIRGGGEGSTNYNLTVNSPLPRTTGGYDVVVRVLQTTIWPSTAHYQGPREDTTWWWGFYRLQSDRQQPTTKDHGRIRRGGEGSTDYNLTINSPLPRTTGGYDVVVRVLQTTIWPSTAHYQGPREDTTWWWGFYRLQSDHQQPTTKSRRHSQE